YIVRTLAHKDENLPLINPFSDTHGDVYFLLRIHTRESIAGGQLNIFEEVDLPDFYNRFKDFPKGYDEDPVIKSLFNKVENTKSSFFITGKAGTGKSTFLHYFAKNTKKRILVL